MRLPLWHLAALGILPLFFAACGTPPTPPEDQTPPEMMETRSGSSLSSSAVLETHNVTYVGIVRPAGVSIYMEGTHRLELGNGRFILLSSETVDLNGYVGEKTDVTGSVRPTVEEGGTIMRVEKIRLVDDGSASSDAGSSAATSTPPSPPPIASSKPATAPAASSAASKAATPPAPPSDDTATPPLSAEFTARVQAMAKQNMAADNWTQAYCTTHIGFCFPVHRNWWFKSFGAGSVSLWHVEVSSEEITQLGEGPLVVNLRSGSVASTGAKDGDVLPQGSSIMGYREWTENRHFEISAPAALQATVEYITAHLSAAEQTP